MMTNVFYFDQINSIGGIETFFYQLGKKYGKDYDITLFYRTGDAKQVQRLSEYIRVRKYRDGQTIRCKRAFVTFYSDILNYIEADEYYQVLHGDYTAMQIYPKGHAKIGQRISVSEVVRDSYRNAKGIDSIVCYNPYTPEKPNRVLRLISATRLTAEKGWPRMEQLAAALEQAGVKFTWTVYTDTNKTVTSPNIIIRPPRLDIIDFIADADYFVQLSNCEGYCYSVVEALCAGTPVIVTDFPVAHEIGVVNGKNGFILPMDMQNLPIAEISKGLKKFKYEPPADKWGELLARGAPDFESVKTEMVRVRCKKYYFDLVFSRHMNYGEEWEATRIRAEQLENLNLVDILE